MSRRLATWIVVLVIFLAIVVSAAVAGGQAASGLTTPIDRDGVSYVGTQLQSGDSDLQVAVVPVTGTLMSGDSSPDGGVTGSDDVIRMLDEIAESDRFDGVMLRLDTPGGGVLAAAEIHDAILRLKKADIPVLAWMRGTAASAGYYIAAPTDRIVAAPETVTGSIGVILQYVEASELAEEVGVSAVTIKSGELKDMGSPFRKLTVEERAVLQAFIDESFDEFVRVVGEGRDMSESKVREIADGRIYTGRQAEELDLVDELGLKREAFAAMAKLLDAPKDGAEIDVVEFGRSYGLFETLGADVQPALASLESIGNVASVLGGDASALSSTARRPGARAVGNGFLDIQYRATL
ncbi:MAG: putative proteinase [Thermoleophilia bacterium]|nr:putative proteinase [Thermoleophilia bacterium]